MMGNARRHPTILMKELVSKDAHQWIEGDGETERDKDGVGKNLKVKLGKREIET